MVFYVLAMIIFIASFVFVWRKSRKNLSRKSKRILMGCATVVFLWAVVRMIWRSELTWKAELLFCVGAEALFGLLAVRRKTNRQVIRFVMKTILVLGLVEGILFQYPAMRLWDGKDYREVTLDPTKAEIKGENYTLVPKQKRVEVNDGKEIILTFKKVNVPVGSFTVDVTFGKETKRVAINAEYTDDTTSKWRTGKMKQTVYEGQEKSQTMLTYIHGSMHEFQIKLTSPDKKVSYSVGQIRMNQPIAMDVSLLRLVLASLVVGFLYFLLKSKLARQPWMRHRKFFRVASMVFFLGIGIVAVIIMLNQMEQYHKPEGDQMTKELVEAFEAGQVSLLLKPTKELLAMENPYNNGERSLQKVKSKWDHVFYNGKYYSYYGIAPVVLVFLPYHLLTKQYFPTPLAVMLFGVVGMFFLLCIFRKVLEQFLPRITLGGAICGEIVLIACCSVWYPMGRPVFYETAVSAAFMFVTAGTYFLLRSRILCDGPVKKVSLTLSSLFLGLSVLSRPTMALYCFVACLAYFFGFRRLRKTMRRNRSQAKGPVVSYWVAALLPLAILAIVQMTYNAARFGSIFDFGIQYSLTINDFTNTEFHGMSALVCLVNYLMSPVKLSMSAPFVQSEFSMLGHAGFFFKDAGTTAGILWTAPVIWSWLLYRKSTAGLNRSQKQELSLLWLLGLVMPLIIMASAWESGYAVRYMADFSWEMVLPAFILLGLWSRKQTDGPLKEVLFKGMVWATLAILIINALYIYGFDFRGNYHLDAAYQMERLCLFWK